MRAMKNRAIVCNIGHFDSEIQIDALRNYTWDNVKPQVDEVLFPDGKRLIVLSGRTAGEPRQRHRPSELRDERASFTNQVLAQLELWTAPAGKYERKVYTLPKQLDEKVAALHLAKVGAHLTKLSPEAGRVYRRDRQRSVQARPLPLLRTQPRMVGCASAPHRPDRPGRCGRVSPLQADWLFG